MFNLDNQVIVITGAARGLGAEIAMLASSMGAAIVVTDINTDAGRITADGLPGPAIFRKLDVTSEDDWTGVLDATQHEFGPPTGLVNNAGVLHMGAIETTSLADAARILNVNVLGTFLGVRSSINAMRSGGGGSIVNIASIDGIAGMNSVGIYSASKFAIRGFTKSAALELGQHNIRVNALCPAMGNPEMSAPFMPEIDVARYVRHLPPPILPEASSSADAARMAVFLLSDASKGCTGADFIVDAGWLAGHYCPGLPGF